MTIPIKAIELFPKYQIDGSGHVFSQRGRRLKVRVSNCGYSRVVLYVGGKGKTMSIHRLVAGAFVSNNTNKPHVNHKNGIKTDNRAENLEWVTMSENFKHAFKLGLKDTHGEKHPRHKLTEAEVKKIRASLLRPVDLAKVYGVSYGCISGIIHNRNWK